jgi:ubiquinone/menaquinone biosynthesis C-methylase UbiE
MGSERPQYEQAAYAFDAVADDYDLAYGADGNLAMRWMRAENLKILRETFPPGSRLLEIGCGTGEEAVALASEAPREVLATDVSPRMAAITLRKARRAGVGDRVQALALPAGGLAALQPATPFDGAYASFGALNCEPDLEAVASALARIVRPGGAFVCSVMGRTCLFEMLWYLLHGRPRRAFRRLRRGWQPAPVAGVDGREVSVATRYLGWLDMVRTFTPAFRVESALALPLLLPPPYADALWRRYGRRVAGLVALERRLRARRPFRALGDHVVLVMRRTGPGAQPAGSQEQPGTGDE